MTIEIPVGQLHGLIKAAGQALAPRAVHDWGKCVELSLSEGVLTATGTDLQTTVQSSLDVDSEEEWIVYVEQNRLEKWLNLHLPNKACKVTNLPVSLRFKVSGSQHTVRKYDGGDFPITQWSAASELSTNGFALWGQELKRIVRVSAPFAHDEGFRLDLQGISLYTTDRTMRGEALDGYAYISQSGIVHMGDAPPFFFFPLSKNALNAYKLFDDTEQVWMVRNDNSVELVGESARCQIILPAKVAEQGNKPLAAEFEQGVTTAFSCYVNRQVLLDALKRLSIIAVDIGEMERLQRLLFSFEDGKLVVQPTDTQGGTGKETIDINIQRGQSFEPFASQHKYLSEALASLTVEEVMLARVAERGALYLTTRDGSILAVIADMHQKEAE